MDKRNRPALAYLLVGVASAGRAMLAMPDAVALQEVSLTVLALVGYLLLAFIGGNMIKESFGKSEELNDDFGFKTMFLMAVATSIDALAVGITFAFLNVSIIPAASLIGVTTFIIAAVGIYIGNVFGAKYKSKAELAGGIILVLIGVKILLEHLGIVNF